MSTINKTFKTSKTSTEMRQIINKLILDMPALKSVIENMEWQENELHFKSKIGNGYFKIMDYSVEILINLNFIGNMAKSQIESALDQEFLKLDSHK